MLRIFLASLAALSITVAAYADTYSTEVETLQIGSARKVGLFKQGISAGGQSLVYQNSSSQSSLNGVTEAKVEVGFDYGANGGPRELRGKCSIAGGSYQSIFGPDWSGGTDSVYFCSFKSAPNDNFGLEVQVPPLYSRGFRGGVTVTNPASNLNPSDTSARLEYDGVIYDAFPTNARTPIGQMHMVEGYSIYRGEDLVGRVDFSPNVSNRGVITAPLRGSEDRNAVIFLGLQLLVMPNVDDTETREKILGQDRTFERIR